MTTAQLGYTGDVVIFDLDDTLYPEAEYADSGFCAVAGHVANADHSATDILQHMRNAAESGANAFDTVADALKPADRKAFIADCVQTYRFHKPRIAPYPDAFTLLSRLSKAGVRMGLITDGATLRQQMKIDALGIREYFDPELILISEAVGTDKLAIKAWQSVVRRYPNARRFFYIADNPAKDFLWPNRLGWHTVQLNSRGANIHSQTATHLSPDYLPKQYVDSLDKISL